jgi:hypothetical protein
MVVKLKISSWGEVGTTTLIMGKIVGHNIEPNPALEIIVTVDNIVGGIIFRPRLFNFNGPSCSLEYFLLERSNVHLKNFQPEGKEMNMTSDIVDCIIRLPNVRHTICMPNVYHIN